MATRTGGSRRKTRYSFKKHFSQKGKVSIPKYLQEFKNDDKVVLKVEPSVHEGLFHGRFQGKQGVVIGKRGECYEVEIKDINKKKVLNVHPIHLKKMQ